MQHSRSNNDLQPGGRDKGASPLELELPSIVARVSKPIGQLLSGRELFTTAAPQPGGSSSRGLKPVLAANREGRR